MRLNLAPAQFNALAKLLRMQPASATREAARLVLVDGISGAEAGRRLGISASAVAQALAGCRKGMELARVVAGEYFAAERAEAIATLRSVCADHGDNDWPDSLHLADVIEKHLARHLDAG